MYIRFLGIIRFLWEIVEGSMLFLSRVIIFHTDFKGSISDTVYLWSSLSGGIHSQQMFGCSCSVVCDAFALLLFIVPYVWPILSLHDSELSLTQGRVFDFISLSLLFSFIQYSLLLVYLIYKMFCIKIMCCNMYFIIMLVHQSRFFAILSPVILLCPFVVIFRVKQCIQLIVVLMLF